MRRSACDACDGTNSDKAAVTAGDGDNNNEIERISFYYSN